jgi:hypothetical protein
VGPAVTSTPHHHLIRRQANQYRADRRQNRDALFVDVCVARKNKFRLLRPAVEFKFDASMHADKVCRHARIRNHVGALRLGEKNACGVLRPAHQFRRRQQSQKVFPQFR